MWQLGSISLLSCSPYKKKLVSSLFTYSTVLNVREVHSVLICSFYLFFIHISSQILSFSYFECILILLLPMKTWECIETIKCVYVMNHHHLVAVFAQRNDWIIFLVQLFFLSFYTYVLSGVNQRHGTGCQVGWQSSLRRLWRMLPQNCSKHSQICSIS